MSSILDEKLKPFLVELEELCKKHKFMIGPGSFYPSLIEKDPGDLKLEYFTDHEIYLTWRV